MKKIAWCICLAAAGILAFASMALGEVPGGRWSYAIDGVSAAQDKLRIPPATPTAKILFDNLTRVSPDGQAVVLVTASNYGMYDAEIRLRYGNDDRDHLLVTSTAEYWVSNPVWSPDGHRIAYIRYVYVHRPADVDIQPELWVLDLSSNLDLQVAGTGMFHPSIGLAGEVSSVRWQSPSELSFEDERLPAPTRYTFDIDQMVVVSKETVGPIPTLGQPSAVPCFRQCGSPWGDDQLGTCSGKTVCSHGCAVTSVSMILRYFGVSTDPGGLNDWLTDHGGYANGCDIRWWVADDISDEVTYQGVTGQDWNRLNAELDAGYPVEARVAGDTHSVVIVRREGSTYYINDPLSCNSGDTLAKYGSTFARLHIYHPLPGTEPTPTPTWTPTRPVPTPTSPPPPPPGDWQVRYFNDLNLSGPECGQGGFNGPYVFMDWGDDAPGGSCNREFSARIWRTLHFADGDYTFYLFADDHARLLVRGAPGGDLVVDQWNGTAHIEGRHLYSRDYEVVVEYNDTGGRAVVGAWWTGPSFPAMPHDTQDPYQWYGEYWANRHWWENAVFQRNEGNRLPFEHNWGDDGPGYGLPADKFATRFTRTAYFECGRYRFEFNADDHAELWVDPGSSPPLLHFGGSGYQSREVDIPSGFHQVKVDHREEGGAARLRVNWDLLRRCPTPTYTRTPTRRATATWTPTGRATATWTPTRTLTRTPTPPCQSITVDSVSIRPRSVFYLGDSIDLVIGATNHTASTLSTLWSWTVYDPSYQKVPSLSYENWSYEMPPGWSGYRITRQIPTNLFGGVYTFVGRVSTGAESDSKSTTFTIIAPTATPTPTWTRAPTRGPTPTAYTVTPLPPMSITFEAEDGGLTWPMTTGTHPGASSCGYITSPFYHRGEAGYRFHIDEGGIYYLWVRGMGGSWTSNSFWISMDDEWERTWEIPQDENGNWDWVWENVMARYVSRGYHTLIIRSREADARLDRLEITSRYPGYVGPSPIIPCGTPTSTATATQTPTPTYTRTPTRRATATWTLTHTPTRTPTPTYTRTPTRRATATCTLTHTPTRTPTPTYTHTPTRRATATCTLTHTPTRTPTPPRQSITVDSADVGPKSVFYPGDRIDLGIGATNHTANTLSTLWSWVVYDPSQQKVLSLSYENWLYEMPPGWRGYGMTRQIPTNLSGGVYTFVGRVSTGAESDSKSTTFIIVAPTLTPTPTRTHGPTRTPTPTWTLSPTWTPTLTPTATPHNLAPNPGFEKTNRSGTGPAGWRGNHWAGPAPTYRWITSVRHSGTRAVQIVNHSDATRSRWRAPKVAVQPGQFYRYGVWVKGSQIAGTARLTMVFIKADGTRLGKKDSSLVRGTFDWQRIGGMVIPPPGTRYIRLELRLHRDGKVWFDDVVLEGA